MERTLRKVEKDLRILSEYLDSPVEKEHGFSVIRVPDHMGSGRVRCICFNKCMSAFEFDITLRQDLRIPLNPPEMDTLYFAYCLEGSCRLKLHNSDNLITLDTLQTAVIYNTPDSNGALDVQNGDRFIFNLISIDRERYERYFENDDFGLEGRLKELLSHFRDSNRYFHLGAYNLKIGEHIKLLQNQDMSNEIASYLHFEGLCNLILANQISQFHTDLKFEANPTTLSRQELQMIHQVSEFVGNYPEVQHSIRSLCKKSGISPNKLQEGFKFMHGRTVSDFVRNVRVEKSEVLLRTTDMNISEVVYSVGLTSRSYFCKIFKAKYGCSPKHYKRKRWENDRVPVI